MFGCLSPVVYSNYGPPIPFLKDVTKFTRPTIPEHNNNLTNISYSMRIICICSRADNGQSKFKMAAIFQDGH